jgi:hypothetical protein
MKTLCLPCGSGGAIGIVIDLKNFPTLRILAHGDQEFWRKPISDSDLADRHLAEAERPHNNAG